MRLVYLKTSVYNNLMKIIIDFLGRHSTIFLIIGMLLTGSLNTILTKLQDSVCVDKCDTEFPVYFEQPMIQTLNMFVGEIVCLLWLLIYNNNSHNNYTLIDQNDDNVVSVQNRSYMSFLLLFFPAVCDSMSSTLMNLGLMFTSASIFQMLRGSMVIFTGIISCIFLQTKYSLNQWLSLIVIFLGITVVGSSHLNNNEGNTFVGVLLIVSAQIFSASQYVIEEVILIKYNVEPLLAVGIEGIFGLIIMTIIAIIFQMTYYINTLDGLRQLVSYPMLYGPSIGIVISISLFNWFGLCITKNISSTSRATIDICRTLIIWCVSLTLQWETFKWLQIIGFLTMICGIFIFNKKEFSTN
jgi:drug/metabolite transporter (DMT)-like permease